MGIDIYIYILNSETTTWNMRSDNEYLFESDGPVDKTVDKVNNYNRA